jgi:hypothetical protein
MDVKRRQREFSLFIIVLFYTETAIIIAGIEREISTWIQKDEETQALHIPWKFVTRISSPEMGKKIKEYTALRKRHCALYSEFLNYVALCRECPNATKQTKHSAEKWSEEYRFNDITDCRS